MFDLDIPNLDHMEIDELEQFREVLHTISAYASIKAKAMQARVVGDICKAMIHEECCDRLYKTLPKDVRW